MIRFLTHILDIKNLLGMQRAVPPVPIVNPQIVLSASATCSFIPTFTTGELIVQYTAGGVLVEERYDTSYSGQQITINTSGYVKMINTTDHLVIDTIEAISGVVNMEIRQDVLNVRVPESVAILRAENALDLQTITNTDANYGVWQLYAHAETPDQRDAYIGVINNNVPFMGLTPELNIDSNNLYAPDVITAATAQGWIINT